MKKFTFLLLSSAILLFAVQLQITPDKRVEVTRSDASALKSFLKEFFHFYITENGAYDLVKKNRVLANQYLKEYPLREDDISYLKIQIERYLADKYVKQIQKKEQIDEKVLLSYYLDHKNNFKKLPKVDTVLFLFNDPDKAIVFYEKVKGKDYAYAQTLAKELNATVKHYGWRTIDKLKHPTREFVEKSKKSNYFLPPLVLNPYSAGVLYVKEYKAQEGYRPFEDVKDEIRELLWKETFVKVRNRLLKEYGASDDE